MYTNEDLRGFFDSLGRYEKLQRDVVRTIAENVEDQTVKQTLLRISSDEQRHMDIVQQMIDLVFIE
ncbi:hypothetical protein G9409_09230 [Chlorobium sp. BLA1]|uniref:hypothetical protein n=1 Tax=Candidatus Chlorobium masyuteum TaxID=2716876 RepID=UPI00141E1F5C|nr:hypothetical protein [Candidatus Chlorobium masyuteum]NHQ60760.1 hypothetical protein [Candidatus Chlorobium masyuteum]NTU45397.1 hypothetical protein [Chlorobiaceae bacterium]NTW70118.1 hypothetical protein [Chlorobiaceae bacterium]